MSNYPPGHPTGVAYSQQVATCGAGHEWTVNVTYERDVNYTDYSPEQCPECGADWESAVDVEIDDGGDRAYDAMMDDRLV